MATGKYLSKRKAADWLDVSEKTIDRLCAAGEFDAIKVSATKSGVFGSASPRSRRTSSVGCAALTPPNHPG